ncbi:RagB/SusD family nutrient uptake outer membrane protein [Prevotella sp. KH2C16]|uniref:RagB/SusD family nutrient uptake outer membrane protein n=1 Tax=Prevotella sp. KH2C16 TaxID=1855325 RepID=UPI0008E6C580|nr:RagB/SusD family nutrient uptake outer membrane protein [Prevotella sp. KH2C16]SFG27035.1 SusD family protein [Prevotella sp. KH2C16]
MKKIIFFLPALVLLLSSCGDFLEEESQSEVIPKTASDFSELLVGNGYPDNAVPAFGWIGFMDDDCEAQVNAEIDQYDENWNYIGRINNFAGESMAVTPMPLYTWQPYSQDLDGFGTSINETANATTYGQCYQKIMGCNAVLDGIDNATGTQEQRDRVKAEALAVRSLLYFQLVNIYGEPYNYNKEALGVPLKLDANLSKDGIARVTVGQVYDKVIVPGLQEAARLMDPYTVQSGNFHITQPVIHILLSRAYLFMEKYKECIEETDKAFKFGIRLANLPVEFNSTWSAGNQNPFTYANPEVLWVFGPSTRPENSSYKDGAAISFLNLWQQYKAANSGETFTSNDANYDMRWDQFGLKAWNENTGVILKSTGSGLIQNIRTAEAYLNKMEAEALLHQDANALKDLNAFCATRYANYTPKSYSGDELLKQIRDERRREFCFEGFRWFDLRRQGMPEITHIYRTEKAGPNQIYTLKHNDPLYTVPLPQSVFEYNTSLIQNEARKADDRQPVDIKN